MTKHQTESVTGQPRPPTLETIHAQEVLIWKARARQNKAEARAAEAERDLWQQQARKWEARAKKYRRIQPEGDQ